MENSNNQQQALTHIESLPPLKLAEDPRVQSKFIDIYDKVHGNQMGKHVYEVEKFHFMKQISENKGLQECSKLSLYGAFMDVAVQGLSFDPTKRLCYLVPHSHNVGTKNEPKWEKRAALQISPYGELYLRQYFGQIKSADNPIVVYEGDEFSVRTSGAGREVIHNAQYPRKSQRIIACFVRIIKPDGSVDFGIMDELEMARLRAYSEKKNQGKANTLYGVDGKQFDTGFLIAKTIKHAFKSYPKVKLRGNFTVLETEIEDKEEIAIDYGLAPVQSATPLQEAPAAVVNTANTATATMTMSGGGDDNGNDMF